MKINISLKSGIFIGFLLLLIVVSYLAPERSDQVKVISTFPATVCPAIGLLVEKVNAHFVASSALAGLPSKIMDIKVNKTKPARKNLRRDDLGSN